MAWSRLRRWDGCCSRLSLPASRFPGRQTCPSLQRSARSRHRRGCEGTHERRNTARTVRAALAGGPGANRPSRYFNRAGDESERAPFGLAGGGGQVPHSRLHSALWRRNRPKRWTIAPAASEARRLPVADAVAALRCKIVIKNPSGAALGRQFKGTRRIIWETTYDD